MPSGIYLPPWLQPVDRIGPFMQGVSQGVNMARTALASQAQAFQAQQEQQELALRQQQEERAVLGAVASVIQHKEEQKRQQQLVDLKAQSAAQQYMAHQEYEAAVASGEDPAKAFMRIAPRMGINPASMMGRFSGQAGTVEEIDYGGRKIPVIRQPSGTITPLPQSPEQREEVARRRMIEGVDYSAWRTDYNAAVRAAAAAQKALNDFEEKTSNKMLEASGDTTIPEMREGLIKRARDAANEVIRLRDQGITKTGTGAKSPYPEGTKLRNKKDGKLYEIRNGEPVLIGE